LDPVETYSTNVMGLVNVLEAVRSTPSIRAVVNVTTDKCYENKEWDWGYRENEPMGGHDPYSSSKACSELITAAYRSSYFSSQASGRGVALASARAGNVIGGGDWAKDRLIPDIITAFNSNRPVLIRNPHAIRPWQHVLEPLRGYLSLAEKLFVEGRPYDSGWNFGPYDHDTRPVSWIVDQLADKWDGAQWSLDIGTHPHEASFLKLDISKAMNGLKWQPELDLQAAINLIAEWYKQIKMGDDARKITMSQISKYESIFTTK